MSDLDRITIVLETLPGARAQVSVNINTPTPGMRLATPAHALAIDALGWLGKQPCVAGFVYGGAALGEQQARESQKFTGDSEMRQAFEIEHGQSWEDPEWRHETGIWASAWHKATAAAQAAHSAVPSATEEAEQSILIDMKQAAELLELFGGQPAEFTLLQCTDGHSGQGLYAYYTEFPDLGASYLGKTDAIATHSPTAREVEPARMHRWAEAGKAIERACEDLPEGAEIIVTLEKDAGTVTLIDQDGNEQENFPIDNGLASVVNAAIRTAIAYQVQKGQQQ
ncbi:MAG: hypothetical protein LBJ15_11230 [Comamonas sp.]|jgi:hypothetical protein|uniref:hypothetical protein n=1 Tax=Comamonas sp. TaxID=34028 RepID=UPI00282C8E06|nr:hypothetical protein [Comamonas sp.]MDR0214563.1 hypothetical protein [Comamonas sp.]